MKILRSAAPLAAAGLAALLSTAPAPARAQEPPPPSACGEVAEFSRLDFWVGEWDVYAKGEKVGTNKIEKILDGCAVTEDWAAAGGGRGRSFFYYVPSTKEWKQVWVTARAMMQGGVKEKRLVETLPDGGLRFQGELPRSSEPGTYFDRTTLTPLPGGNVRQVIEVSGDGKEWRTVWDSVYVPKGGAAPGVEGEGPAKEPGVG